MVQKFRNPAGANTDEQQAGNENDDDQLFAEASISEAFVLLRERTVKHAVRGLQNVDGGRRDGENRENRHDARERGILLERANEDGAFGDESAKAREAKPCETGKHKAYAEERHLAHDTAHFRDVTGVGAFVNHADGREEKPGQESVRNHLEASAAKSNRRHGCKSEEDEAQVADGTVSGDILEVFVADGNEWAENHVKDEERDNVREPNLGGFRHEEHRNAEASVGTHFHHHAGSEHRNGCRCGGVTVRAPEVEREERTRNGKSHEHERECPHLEIHRKCRLCNFNEVPACSATFEVKPKERCKNH